MRFSARGTGPSIASALTLGAALAVVGLFGAGAVGCTPNQGVGERCSATNGNDDCTSGLVCRSSVCCPTDDTSCGAAAVSNADSATDTGLVVEAGPDTGYDAVNSACVYESECPIGLFCRSGHCIYECAGDRDCTNGKGCDCASRSCVAPTFSIDHHCGDAGAVDAPPADTGSVVDSTAADTVDETADTASVDSGTDAAADVETGD